MAIFVRQAAPLRSTDLAMARVGIARNLVGRLWLKVFGWELVTETPTPKSFVLLAAPHTSGWDLPFMLATSWVMDVPISWMGKRELFAPPFGWFMRFLGGIPIDRSRNLNTVAWSIEQLQQSPDMVLAVPAKGTRARAEYWKSGFYHIAKGAQVPIGLARLDFGRKRCGVGAFVMPTDDLSADMDRIRAFYADVIAKFPELEAVPRLREEDARPVTSGVAVQPAAA
jgi:1-acyl-sn-glycerol-3-phosphate acyltransferase